MIKRNSGVMKFVIGLQHRNPRVVMLKVRLYHGSPRVVKLEVWLHHGCPGTDQEMSQGGEAKDGALLREFYSGGE